MSSRDAGDDADLGRVCAFPRDGRDAGDFSSLSQKSGKNLSLSLSARQTRSVRRDEGEEGGEEDLGDFGKTLVELPSASERRPMSGRRRTVEVVTTTVAAVVLEEESSWPSAELDESVMR